MHNHRQYQTQGKTNDWCRGIQFGGTDDDCRLLSEEQPDPSSKEHPNGWTAYNFGNWAEPAQWKNGYISGFKCYEKIIPG
jgi:hypothetical protein